MRTRLWSTPFIQPRVKHACTLNSEVRAALCLEFSSCFRMVSVLWTNCRRQRWFRHALQLRRLLSLSASPPYLNLTQEDLVKLPLARFTGDCILISTPQDEEKYASAIDSLFSNAVLGFDTEWHCWRPRRAPSLVQLASEDVCIMWRLCYRDQEKWFVGADFPPKLFNLLNTHRIIKVCW